jgi:hypothetical protein
LCGAVGREAATLIDTRTETPQSDTATSALRQLEAFAGTIAAGLVSVIFIISGIALLYFGVTERHQNRLTIAMTVAGVLLLAMEAGSITYIFRQLQRPGREALLSLAREHPRWPLLLRPLVATWWIAHFVALALLAENVFHGFRLLSDVSQQRAAILILQYLVFMGASFGSNAFLLLAVGSLSRTSAVVTWIFRARLLIDGLIAGVLMLLPLHFKW